jgi:hypothetical protein
MEQDLGIKKLATLGETIAYSSSQLDRLFFKIGSIFTPQGQRPREQFLVKNLKMLQRRMETNLAMEQVTKNR